jgi:hypothetical protein
MSESTPGINPETNSEELLRSLRRKQGTWVEWGQACQQLQKAGYRPQAIFEETGFEPIQQNQIVVAAQVYASLLSGDAPTKVLEYYQQRGSDSLYELRILSQRQRVTTAELLVEKGIDSEGAKEVAKAVKETSYLTELPEGFSEHPGDAVAYQCWKAARHQDDLQARSHLIARGLRFAYTPTARQHLEKLLTDFTVVKARSAPRLPVYRLESEEEMPRILPVVGKLPLTKADLQAVPLVEETGAFKLVKFTGEGAWVPVPGWQVILLAEDPVVLLCDSQQLPTPLPGKPEEVLLVVDRAQRQWNSDSYFLIELEDQLVCQWFEEAPGVPLLGRIILVMRPKKILDEDLTKDPWQIDE